MNKKEFTEFYQIDEISDMTISLVGSNPPIYRQLEVKSDTTLFEFHCMIQTAMGWTNSHLFEFRRGDLIFGVNLQETIYEFPDLIEAAHVRIAALLKRPGQTLTYIYDFGDSWEHKIKLNRHLPIEKGKFYPACITGAGKCPPEDCGGMGGFYNLLKILGNPKDPEYKEVKTWVGRKYDPEDFQVDAMNRKLRRIKAVIREMTEAWFG